MWIQEPLPGIDRHQGVLMKDKAYRMKHVAIRKNARAARPVKRGGRRLPAPPRRMGPPTVKAVILSPGLAMEPPKWGIDLRTK